MLKDDIDVSPQLRLWWTLVRTKRLMHKIRNKELKQANISLMEAGILFALREIGNKPTPADISRWLIREPHGISLTVNRMAKRGLVRKTRDTERKNLVRLEMTEKGQEAYLYAAQAMSIQNMMSSLSDEEQQKLDSYLLKLQSKALEELGIHRQPLWP